jgi:hypothetical protein
MTTPTHSIRSLGGRIGRSLPRLALVIVGFVLMVVGVAMTATIVMLPAGMVLGLLGVATFLAGIFAPDRLDARGGDQ